MVEGQPNPNQLVPLYYSLEPIHQYTIQRSKVSDHLRSNTPPISQGVRCVINEFINYTTVVNIGGFKSCTGTGTGA